MTNWKPTSWQDRPTDQQPVYKDLSALDAAVKTVSHLPPLVSSWEIEALKTQLGEAASGKRFLLQAGDCAERFSDCRPEHITGQLKVLLQMSLVLVHSTKRRSIRIGRLAGQYAKPRSSNDETVDGVTLPSYRGDLVNDIALKKRLETQIPTGLFKGSSARR